MRQTWVYSFLAGESSDKAFESGAPRQGVITQMQGCVPLIPSGDLEGGAVCVPGWRIHGDAPFTFIPGVDPEDGIPGGSPSATPEESAYWQKTRYNASVHPDLSGTIFTGFYSSDGEDSETGRGCFFYQELWGSQSNSAGDITSPYGTVAGVVGDFDFIEPDSNPKTYIGGGIAYVIFQWEAAAGAVSYDILRGSSIDTMEVVDTTASTVRDAFNIIPYQGTFPDEEFVPGTYFIQVRATDAEGNVNYTPPYTVIFRLS